MLKVEIDIEQLQQVINEAIARAFEKHIVPQSLPPILSKAQLMELLDIGKTKAAELLNREDFPVTRELGHPKVLTHLLIRWMEQHTEWVSENASNNFWSKRGA